MSLSQNFSDLYTALNVSSVTSLLGTYNSGPALWADSRIPADYTSTGATINFYLADRYDGREGYAVTTLAVNCRAATSYLSRSLADAVIDAINRVNYTGYYITCVTLPEIGPQDENDNYNTVINVTINKN